jgi:hypothetical protein
VLPPLSITATVRRRCKLFLSGQFETLWHGHDWDQVRSSTELQQDASELNHTVEELIRAGALSRAAARLVSAGLAPAPAETVSLLQAKCPPSDVPRDLTAHAQQLPERDGSRLGSAIPPLSPTFTEADIAKKVAEWKKIAADFPARSAPAGDGWRYEYLKEAIDACGNTFVFILEAIRHQTTPPAVRALLSIPRLLAFLKPDPADRSPPSLAHGIRPIGIPSVFHRAATRPVATAAAHRWADRLLLAGQHGLGISAGVETVPRALQLLLEHDPTLAVDSEDCTNGFNELERGAIFDILAAHDPDLLQHFLAYYTYDVPQYFRMTSGELVNIPSCRGGIQGDFAFSAIFDVVYTVGVLEPLAAQFPTCNMYAIHDDSYICGPAAALPLASHRLAKLGATCGLRYGAAKRKLYQHPQPALGADPATDVRTHAASFPPGATLVHTCFKVGGVPVGLDDAAIVQWCDQKATL